jgi:hypothetical protein
VSDRSHWWVSRDVRRLIARCEFTSGGPIDTAELRYLRLTAEVLLAGLLPLADGDRESVEQVHLSVRLALAARTDERIEAP